jgi:hypothetical protein
MLPEEERPLQFVCGVAVHGPGVRAWGSGAGRPQHAGRESGPGGLVLYFSVHRVADIRVWVSRRGAAGELCVPPGDGVVFAGQMGPRLVLQGRGVPGTWIRDADKGR